MLRGMVELSLDCARKLGCSDDGFGWDERSAQAALCLGRNAWDEETTVSNLCFCILEVKMP